MESMNTTTRLVVSGHIGPRRIINIDPNFGTQDEWSAVMANVVDALPEEMEATEDYESWLEDVIWMRQGC